MCPVLTPVTPAVLYLPANENTHTDFFNSPTHTHSLCVYLSLQYRLFIPHHSLIVFFHQAVNMRETAGTGAETDHFHFICQSIVSLSAVMLSCSSTLSAHCFTIYLANSLNSLSLHSDACLCLSPSACHFRFRLPG